MAEWLETYRGVVSAWECDIVEHFTIAYYFEKFADATRNFLDLIDEGQSLGDKASAGPSRLHTTFQHELRAGDGFHVLSAVTSVDQHTLCLGHQMLNSTTGEVGTWLTETIGLPAALAASTRRKLEGMAVAWPGPALPASDATRPTGAITARDRVKPWEVDEQDRLSLSDHVHRFSGAGMQFLTSIGMTGKYMHENRRGFSTFLLDIELAATARLGERIDVRTTVAHLGNTSLRYVHHMTGGDGRPVASMVQAGVQLDTDARRPTPFPPEVRERIAKLLAKA